MLILFGLLVVNRECGMGRSNDWMDSIDRNAVPVYILGRSWSLGCCERVLNMTLGTAGRTPEMSRDKYYIAGKNLTWESRHQ
ncbi:hypothetical protein F4604DRAFT_1782511 [Suillus subluteus]|nr:hypothetical protein F4604DRAFT_1782511 [Suillus subluteus]